MLTQQVTDRLMPGQSGRRFAELGGRGETFQMMEIAAADAAFSRDLRSDSVRQYFFLWRGRGHVELDNLAADLKAGSLIKAPAGGVFELKLERGAVGMLLGYSEAFLRSKVMPVLEPPPGNDWQTYHRPGVYDFFATAERRQQRGQVMRELRAAARRIGWLGDPAVAAYTIVILFQPIYGAVAEQPWSEVAGGKGLRERDLIMAFRGMVDENLVPHLPVREYCARLGVAYTTLARASRAVLGVTPLEYINSRLLIEAKRVLKHSARPVDAVSYELGFNYPGYFTRFFSRHVGCSPTEFRRRPKDFA